MQGKRLASTIRWHQYPNHTSTGAGQVLSWQEIIMKIRVTLRDDTVQAVITAPRTPL
jgi:hypothetical protein